MSLNHDSIFNWFFKFSATIIWQAVLSLTLSLYPMTGVLGNNYESQHEIVWNYNKFNVLKF